MRAATLTLFEVSSEIEAFIAGGAMGLTAGTLLGWLAGTRSHQLAVSPVPAAPLPHPRARSFTIDIAGESFHEEAICRVTGGKTFEGVDLKIPARLILEDSNPVDPNAVRVEIKGEHVGYLPREAAPLFRKRYAAMMGQGFMDCDARIRGGWDRGGDDVGHFGVRLALPKAPR